VEPSETETTNARSEGFFSKSNLHTAGWALVFGAAGYFFSFVDPFGGKPQEVVVKNIESLTGGSGPTVVTLDGKVQADMARLKEALEATQHALSKTTGRLDAGVDASPPASSTDNDVARQLRETQLALQEAMKLAPAVSDAAPNASPGRAAAVSMLVPDSIEAPELPKENRGYTLQVPRGLKGIQCPTYHASSRRLRFAFDVEAAVLKSASFFRVTVASIDAPLKQTHVFGEFFRGHVGFNEVELDFDVPPGSYDVTLGYYDKRRLAGEFPPFYGVSCTVRV
jgi:hypothetical protein